MMDSPEREAFIEVVNRRIDTAIKHFEDYWMASMGDEGDVGKYFAGDLDSELLRAVPGYSPGRVFRTHSCEHCDKVMFWDDQSCACLCRSNKGYNNG